MGLLTELLSSRNKELNEGDRLTLDINHFIDNTEFRNTFENQYLKYHGLGYNVLKAYPNFDDLDMDIFRDFLMHVHENLVPLPDFVYNLLSRSQISFLSRAIYDLLFIEMPALLNQDILEDPMDPISLKFQLIDHYTKTAGILSDLKPNSFETFKLKYAMDMYDNDLSDLIAHHVLRLVTEN